MIDEARLFGLMSQLVTALDKTSGALARLYEHTPEVRQIRADNERFRETLATEHENTKTRIRLRRCLKRIETSLDKLTDIETRRTYTHAQMQRALRSMLLDVTTTLNPEPQAQKED
jgi:hypothetical protein